MKMVFKIEVRFQEFGYQILLGSCIYVLVVMNGGDKGLRLYYFLGNCLWQKEVVLVRDVEDQQVWWWFVVINIRV